ncbi:hypothetical protein GCM10010346_27880 [Streptomyces chryseus]|uniref:Uncharacterized protein n=1 Tax=Streptomyces chryseus TaxID=68186 RepID=A0ABQ3DMT6_9ACTN|nr:hypothetical protein GCM10010346_27880 [Streptomyces chryseus]
MGGSRAGVRAVGRSGARSWTVSGYVAGIRSTENAPPGACDADRAGGGLGDVGLVAWGEGGPG